MRRISIAVLVAMMLLAACGTDSDAAPEVIVPQMANFTPNAEGLLPDHIYDDQSRHAELFLLSPEVIEEAITQLYDIEDGEVVVLENPHVVTATYLVDDEPVCAFVGAYEEVMEGYLSKKPVRLVVLNQGGDGVVFEVAITNYEAPGFTEYEASRHNTLPLWLLEEPYMHGDCSVFQRLAPED